MGRGGRWNSGDQVVLREVWRGKVWSAKPEIVVRDTPDLLALYLPAGTRCRRAVSSDGTPLRLTPEEWLLKDLPWPVDSLRLTVPGASHSIILIWSQGQDEFLVWYVNLEDPLRRTALGFDYMDQVLDIEIAPDLSEWHWKDEDELQQAQDLGLISRERALELRREGERVVALLESGSPPFTEEWRLWRPDPLWQTPRLPAGWDELG
jgi:predicted RNA-binding protein associated with RNAse of E/G family